MTTLNELKRVALDGRIDRREFIRQATALGMTAAAAATLADSAALAETPQKGGTFRIAVDDGNTTDSLDPATYESTFQIFLPRMITNNLTEITSDNELGPDAAESWEATPDAKTWIFKLHKGVEFHNGKSFTADDAVASLNHHRGENSTSGGTALLSTVTDIRAEDAHTVRIDLETGNADLPFIMTDYHFVMFPSDGEGSIDWSGVGLGGYVLEEFEPGIVALGSRNPNYYKEGKANFDAVEIHQVTDVIGREAGVQTGQFDAMIEADPKTADLLAQNENVIVEEIATGQHASMPMHTDVAPFDDVNVRLALKYALDREGALDVVLRGHGTVGNDHPIPPTMPYFDPAIEQRVYDPDRAKWHLQQAGMDSLAVDFSTSEVPFVGGVDFSVFYQETAKAAGIDVNVIREAEDGYWSNVWLVKPFSLCGWGPRPTPDMIFSLGYYGPAPWNDAHWQNGRFDELLIQARAELDDVRRAEMYSEMQHLVRDDGGTIVPFFRNYIWATALNVRHTESVSGEWSLDGNRAPERWWFAEGTV